MRLVKILAVAEGMQSFSAKGLARKANLPLTTAKKYFEMLVDAGYLRRISRGTYQLSVKVRL
jgi:DNA-binding IclR family transcriptional regulator